MSRGVVERRRGRGLGFLNRPLDLGDFRLDPDHVRVLVGESGLELHQLLAQPHEPEHAGVGGGGRPSHRAGQGDPGTGGCRHLGELPAKAFPPLEGAALVVAVQAELGVQALERREVDFHLLGQLADVTFLELADLLLLLVEPGLDLVELDPQEVRGARRLPLANLEVLLDVEGGEGVRDLGDRLGIAASIADGEGDRRLPLLAPLLGAAQLELNVAPHPLDQLLGADTLLQVRVEAEPGDELLEA